MIGRFQRPSREGARASQPEAALFTAAAYTIDDYEAHTFPIEINLTHATTNVIGATNQPGFDLQTALVLPPLSSSCNQPNTFR